MIEHLEAFFPKESGGEFTSASFGRIVSPLHFERITKLLAKTNGTIARGGTSDDKTLKMQMTVVKDVKEDDMLMSE